MFLSSHLTYVLRTIFIVLSIVILIGSYGCKKDFEEVLSDSLEQTNYIPVRVEAIERTDEPIPLYAIGRIFADVETKLSFKTGGYIAGLRADEGDFVKRGRQLGTLRTEEVDAQVLKAERAYEKASRDLNRARAMFEDSVATLENVEDLSTLVEVTSADVRIAKFNQRYSSIVAPVSGRVLKRLAEPNELIAPGQPIFVLASAGRQSYKMKIFISDKDINVVSYGTRSEITFDAFPDQVFQGEVERISESADPMTGTFELEVSVNIGTNRLRSGMIGKVALFPPSKIQYVKIPTVSLSEGKGDRVTVFVPDESDTIALARNVAVARFGDDHVWVDGKEIADERVVTFGSAYLKDGQVIKIIDKKGQRK